MGEGGGERQCPGEEVERRGCALAGAGELQERRLGAVTLLWRAALVKRMTTAGRRDDAHDLEES